MEHITVSMETLAERNDRSYPDLNAESLRRVKAIITVREHSVLHVQETSSPPSSMPRPVSFLAEPRPTLLRFGLPPGGKRDSKFNLRLASLAASGVFAGPGVRPPKAP